MQKPLLSLRNLTRRFSKTAGAAVNDLSLDLYPGEILALIGPSGCGKTTTLRMIAGFETPDSGQVLLHDQDITDLAPERRGIGMVFQDYALFPHLTVAENIIFGAKDKSPENVSRFLSMVSLEGYGNRYPDELSGGQQQRIALARSFAAEPGLILLDEPFSNLDAALRMSTRREIRSLLKSVGISIVFVTHDQEEALSFADRVAIMRDGKVLQQGLAEHVYDHPCCAFAAGFLGRTNLMPAKAYGVCAATALGDLYLTQPVYGDIMLSIRPEQLRLRTVQPDETPHGHIASYEFKGHDMTYWVQCADCEVQIDVMNGERLANGAQVIVDVAGPVVPLMD